MKNNFRRIRASLILGILLFSSLAVFTTNGSAAGLGLFNLKSEVTFSYDSSKAYGIIPADQTGATISLYIQYQIQGILSQMAARVYKAYGLETAAQIEISVGSFPESTYCSASIITQSVQAPIGPSFKPTTVTPAVHVVFLANAPYLAQVNVPVIIKATAPPAFPFRIDPVEKTYYVSVSAAYIPIIDVTPSPIFQETPPGNIAFFNIVCDNKGNGETEFKFDVQNVPEGWSVGIVNSVLVSPNTQKTVSLEIRTPYGFGYHDDQKDITVNVQGFYYASSGQTTNSSVYPVRVTVRDRGFYVSGFDAMIIGVIILVIAIVGYFYYRWRKTK